MAYDWQTKVALQATYEVTKLLRKKYSAEYQKLLAEYKEPKTNYVSKARSALRKKHENEFQERAQFWRHIVLPYRCIAVRHEWGQQRRHVVRIYR